MSNLTTIPDEPQKSANDGILAVIARAASDPSVDVEKLEKMLAMHERVMAKQAEQAFNDAMNKAQKETGRIAADLKNKQTNSVYASYGMLDRVLRPIYTRNGFSLSFDTGDSAPDMVRVLCYVSHSDGHTRTYKIDIPADGKGAKGGDVMTKTHAMGSGTSYGQRYLLKLIFNVAIGEDDDGNGASGVQYITDEQCVTIHDYLVSTEANEPAFLALYGAETVAHIQSKDYSKAISALKQKERVMREKKEPKA